MRCSLHDTLLIQLCLPPPALRGSHTAAATTHVILLESDSARQELNHLDDAAAYAYHPRRHCDTKRRVDITHETSQRPSTSTSEDES